MSEMSNPLLQQAEDKVESQLDPTTKQNYMKIVVAGMHAALSGGPQSLLASLQKSQDPVSDAAKGAVALVLILRKQAQGIMPLKAMVPAAMTLMLKALDFADRSKIVQVGQPELVRATHIFADTIFHATGITKQGLANAAQRVHQITQNPAAVQAMNVKAGVVPHPGIAPPAPATPPPSPARGLMNGAAG